MQLEIASLLLTKEIFDKQQNLLSERFENA